MSRPERAALYVSLFPGERTPALDLQLLSCLRQAEEQGLRVFQVYGDVSGPLEGRRAQVGRFLEEVRRREAAATLSFDTQDPVERAFLARIARRYDWAYAEKGRHVELASPAAGVRALEREGPLQG